MTTDTIYDIQNLINNYHDKSTVDLVVSKLVDIQDRLLKVLTLENRQEVLNNILQGNYPKTASSITETDKKKTELAALDMIDQYTLSKPRKATPKPKPKTEKKFIYRNVDFKTPFKLPEHKSISDYAKTDNQKEEISLLKRNGWEDEEIAEKLNLKID